MAAGTSLSVVSSDSYNQNKCDLNDFECSNCVLLENNFRKETNMAPCEVSHPRRATIARNSHPPQRYIRERLRKE